MGEETDQIERHIQQQRAELGENINELQQKVKDTFDWRAQFEEHPVAMIGVAVGGGLLLSALVGGRPRSSRLPEERWHTEDLPSASAAATYGDSTRSVSFANKPESESWRNIKNALAGVAAVKVGELLDSIIPGFSREYSKVKNGDGNFTPKAAV